MSETSLITGDGEIATGRPYQPIEPPKVEKPNPATPCSAYLDMSEDWQMADDIWGGTKTMQAAGLRWLPKDEGESEDGYTERLSRTIFFNAVKRTVQMLVGKPFSKPVKWGSDMDKDILLWLEDIDRQGRHADLFLKEALQTQIKDGHAIMLVDYDVMYDDSMSLADKQAAGMRPYAVLIDPRNFLFWRSEVRNGKQILTHCRIREVTVEPAGEWGEEEVTRIRVFDLGFFNVGTEEAPDNQRAVRWSLYRKYVDSNNGNVEYRLEGIGFLRCADGEWLDEIPIRCAYGQRTGFFESELPLEDLMFLNIDHWRSSSDQRYILHHARVPKMFAKGFIPGAKPTEAAGAGRVVMGPSRLIATEAPDGDLKYVETTGNAIGAGRENCEDIKMEMAVMGAEKLVKKTVFSTATETMHDNTAEDSELAAMCRSLEDAFEGVLELMARFAGKTIEVSGSVEISKDFGIFPWQLQILAHLINLYTIGALTQLTLLKEFQRLGALSDVLLLEDEVQLSQAEYSKRQEKTQKLQLAAKAGGAPGEMTRQIQNM